MPITMPLPQLDQIQLNVTAVDGQSLSQKIDDFESGSSEAAMWANLGAGTNGYFVTPAVNAHPGIFTMTGATGQIGAIQSVRPSFILGNGYWLFLWMVRVQALATGGDRFVDRAGIAAGIGAGDPTDGIYFEYDVNISPNWRLKTAQASARTALDSGVPVAAATFVSLMATGADQNTANFFINGNPVGSISTTLPAALINFAAHIQVFGATSRGFDVDLFAYQTAFTKLR